MTRFIDVHVHPPVAELLDHSFAPYLDGIEARFGRTVEPMSVDDLAAYYRERDGRAVVLGWDAETATRLRPLSNRRIAEMVAAAPDVFVGFGSVDPHKGSAAVAGVHEAARLGLVGLKFHPPAQQFDPSDRMAYPIWEAAAEHGLICLVHTGYTTFGAGMPGGGGVLLDYARPIRLDRVANEFPSLAIIAAHPSWPWQDEAIAVAQHKPNIYLDLSGWSPKKFSEPLLDAIRGPLGDRVLFGTDFPFLTPDKWLTDWETLGMPDDVTNRVLYDNAAELLDLDTPDPVGP